MNTRAPTTPAARPSAQFCADARRIVSNPSEYANRPSLRRLAWATLMAARGYQVDTAQLAQMRIEVAHV